MSSPKELKPSEIMFSIVKYKRKLSICCNGTLRPESVGAENFASGQLVNILLAPLLITGARPRLSGLPITGARPR